MGIFRSFHWLKKYLASRSPRHRPRIDLGFRLACVLVAAPVFPNYCAAAPSPVQFSALTSLPLLGPAYTAAIGDFNRDGNLDLVVGKDSVLSVFLGDGAGGMLLVTNLPLPTPNSASFFTSVAVGDFNRDGKLDLVGLAHSGSYFVFLGDGSGGFVQGAEGGGQEGTPSSIGLADLNGDGVPDLVIGGFSDLVGVFLGRGDGTFRDFYAYLPPGPMADVALGDVNKDGIVDIVSVDGVPSMSPNISDADFSMTVAFGNGDGTFARRTNFWAGRFPIGVVLADFNGDSKLDAAVLNWSPPLPVPPFTATPGSVSILLGDGAGGFAAPQTFQIPPNPTRIAVADFNGDGYPDIITTHFASAPSTLLINDGHGGFETFTNMPSVSSNYPPVLAIGDFDGDGRPDVVSAMAIWLNSSMPTLRATPGGESIKLWWPDWTGFSLESATGLFGPAGWQPVTNQPVVVNARTYLDLPMNGSARFYRLRKP